MDKLISKVLCVISAEYSILKTIKTSFINPDDENDTLDDVECDGLCVFDGLIPIEIKIRQNMPKDYMIVTLAHECAHAITPNKKAESAHSSLFYKNYALILRLLESKNIFALSSSSKFSKYSAENLKRIDKYTSCENAISIGKILIDE